LLLIEFALAILSDLLGRIVSLCRRAAVRAFSNATSVRLMEHAATLDLEDFEDPPNCRTSWIARAARPWAG
jgi:ATP-binding cassette subfamily B protein